MNAPAPTGAAAPANPPHLTVDEVVYVLNHPIRWHMLKLLAAEPAVMVQQAAKKIGKPATNVSKHLNVLKDMGVADQKIGRLYQLAPQYRTKVGQMEIDFGHCLVRFGQF